MASMTLEELTSQLQKAYGDALRAVVLYGSAASGEHVAKHSDYNVLVVVERLDAEALRNASATTRAWSEAGNPPPLTMTTAEWRGSSDIFPMEYSDILERHRVLFGTPPFDGIRVDLADLRLQVEHEAMGKLLRLRQAILAAGNDQRRQLDVLEQSLSTFMVIFRGVERLNDARPPVGYEELADQVGKRVGFDASPFVRVARHLRQQDRLAPADAPGVLPGYLAGARTLVSYLDHFPTAR